MCRCCQDCMESCYWHLIEKRFCFDESIALYEEPVKDEKNNNMFDNMAFYDSVSVIAGRAIVTIDPLPVVQQPKRLQRLNETRKSIRKDYLSKSVPVIFEESSHSSEEKLDEIIKDNAKPQEIEDLPHEQPQSLPTEEKKKEETSSEEELVPLRNKPIANPTPNSLTVPDGGPRKKSLRERRMSKSLYLKIDQPREIPIIRQSSVPKFFLDTPEVHQAASALYRSPSMVLTSPMPRSSGFTYDLYSVVQMEKERVHSAANPNGPSVHRQPSKLLQIKEKMKLMRTKSGTNFNSSSVIPHSHHM